MYNATGACAAVPVDAGQHADVNCGSPSESEQRAADAPGIDSPHAACGALGHRPISNALELPDRQRYML